MTLQVSTSISGPYNGNDSTTEFAYNFKITASSQLVVTYTDASGTESVWTEGSDYTVDGVGNQNGGTVTTTHATLSPPATGTKLTINRIVPLTQLTDITTGGSFDPQVHEDTFDIITMGLQQLNEQLGRTVQSPVSETPIPGLTLPSPVAENLIGWNSAAPWQLTNYPNPSITSMPITNLDYSGTSELDIIQIQSGVPTWTAITSAITNISLTSLSTSGASVNDVIYYDGANAAWGTVATPTIDLTTDVTGILPDANVADDLTIDGGTVNNSVIGAVTPAAATVTSLTQKMDASLVQIFESYTASTAKAWSIYRSARGTEASPTAIQSGDEIFRGDFAGYGATGFVAGAQILGVSTENFTDAAAGTKLVFKTSSNGSVTPTTRMNILNTGVVQIVDLQVDTSANVDGTAVFNNSVDFINDGAATTSRITSYRAGSSTKSRLQMRGAEGTEASPSVLTSGSDFARIDFVGYDGSAFGVGGKINVSTTALWSGTSYPTEIKFQVCNAGSTTLQDALTINPNTNISVATDLDVDGVLSQGYGGYFPDLDTTPSVGSGNIYIEANTGATTITDFDDGVAGQTVFIIFTTSNTTVQDSGNLRLAGAFTSTSNDTLTVATPNGTHWYEVSRSVN